VQFTHFIHSLAPFFFFSVRQPLNVLDIGSGGGLPGIPIAIVKPEFRILLVDSIAKKVRAMESMINELALPNVTVANSRAEELARNGLLKEKFDLVLARAVGPLADLVRWCRTSVRKGGAVAEWKQSGKTTPIHLPALMAWKGGDLSEELTMMKHRTGIGGTVFPLVFPGSGEAGLEEKKIVVVELGSSGDRS
jgi:16S rRNA (guanine527-N7)-methyltransferase